MNNAKIGDWVEIENIVLPSDERTSDLPVDTKNTDLKQWIRGNLQTEVAALGDHVEIETLIGRTVSGKLVAIKPRHVHDFGDHVEELADIGKELKHIMEGL